MNKQRSEINACSFSPASPINLKKKVPPLYCNHRRIYSTLSIDVPSEAANPPKLSKVLGKLSTFKKKIVQTRVCIVGITLDHSLMENKK